jgi:tetratricopeptide (TPR) repeat protein
VPLFEEIYKIARTKFGPDDLNTLGAISDLALSYREAGEVDKALPLFEETVPRIKAKRGPDHLSTLAGMVNLAKCYLSARKPEKALPLLEATLPLLKKKAGPDSGLTLDCMNSLALAYKHGGQLAKALPLFERRGAYQAKLAPDHRDAPQRATGRHTRKTVNSPRLCRCSEVAAGEAESQTRPRRRRHAHGHDESGGRTGTTARLKGLPLFEKRWQTKFDRDQPETLNHHQPGRGVPGRRAGRQGHYAFRDTLAKAKLGPNDLTFQAWTAWPRRIGTRARRP